jgi:hypothetical protein
VTSPGPELQEYLAPGGCVWLVCYKPGHSLAILWGFGLDQVRVWPDPGIGWHEQAADLPSARAAAARIAEQIKEWGSR